MFFHVTLTNDCNLNCKYCFDEAVEDTDSKFPNHEIDYDLPKKIDYDVSLLEKFCRHDPECIIIFYGGEPLLFPESMKLIMDNVKAKHFIVQTNGILLQDLEPEYVNRLHTIFVSIDGDETLTDYYRGEGTHHRIIKNLRSIKKNGFNGELIARMTVMEKTDIYKQATWLIRNSEFSFSSLHWQLNAGFWDDFGKRSFEKWSKKNYNPGVRKLVQFWIEHMRDKGEVIRIFPFLGITQSLLTQEKCKFIRCGAGCQNYAIQTDGHIIPCPSMWGMKDYYMGHLESSNPLNLGKLTMGESCEKCEIFSVCGGRCLYAGIVKRWSSKAHSLICDTVRNLVNTLQEVLPEIRKLFIKERISLEDFQFMKYNGCEIIP
ncbi:MAG: TIGR04084 family radical SAM/SPASM domain-containing protein [Candidatus Bathyarchaeota archaeon]|jgi:putative peptide-modifying radical SAM enzyme